MRSSSEGNTSKWGSIIVPLKPSSFVKPTVTERKARWRALKSARYDPTSHKIICKWIQDHSPLDTIVLLSEKEISFSEKIWLGEERAVATLPRDISIRAKYERDWVPVAYPDDECDDPVLEHDWSFEEYLSFLSGTAEGRGRIEKDRLEEMVSEEKSKVSENLSIDFPWHRRVKDLEQVLKNLWNGIEGSTSELGLKFYLRMLEGLIKNSSGEESLSLMEKRWREWARFRIIQFVLKQDRRKNAWEPFRKLCDSYKSSINPMLKVLL